MHILHLALIKTRSIWKTLGPFATARCRIAIHQVCYCRTPPAHRCPQQQRQRVTEGTAPWNGPNKVASTDIYLVGVDPESEFSGQQSFQERFWDAGAGGGARQQTVQLPVDDADTAVGGAALRPVGEPVVAIARRQRGLEAAPERRQLVGAQSGHGAAAPQDRRHEVDGAVYLALHIADRRRRRSRHPPSISHLQNTTHGNVLSTDMQTPTTYGQWLEQFHS